MRTQLVVKLQQSLNSSDGTKRCLIYSKNRDIFYETEKDEEVEELCQELGDEPKRYFEAEVKDTKIVLGKRVPDPGW